jgi:poly(3-hydroxybutyrate) depolymerase
LSRARVPAAPARRGLIAAAVALALGVSTAWPQTVVRTMQVGGLARRYRLHVPPGFRRDGTGALVLAFHGRGGDAAAMERLTGFSGLADRAGFAVAYP